MMIAQPDEVTTDRFDLARTDVGRKKDLPTLAGARLQRFEEGTSAQILYIGPFSGEGPTIRRLHAFIQVQGHAFDGIHQKHHEIYLSDPRRSAPQKWRTIIRQPFLEACPAHRLPDLLAPMSRRGVSNPSCESLYASFRNSWPVVRASSNA